MGRCRITVLVDDAEGGTLRAEHGLSLHVETESGTLLLDSGQSDLFIQNADHLGVDLSDVSGIALSHGHYDHTGGLAALMLRTPNANVWHHPDAIKPKYARNVTTPHRFIGMSAEAKAAISGTAIASRRPRMLLPGVWLTGEIPRNTHESVGDTFFTDLACLRPDPLLDDQAMYIQTPTGPIVLLGCAHAGVVNILTTVSALENTSKIRAVIGGMHLLNASEHSLHETARALDYFQVEMVVPLHCTGSIATDFLHKYLGPLCVPGSCGTVFEFQ